MTPKPQNRTFARCSEICMGNRPFFDLYHAGVRTQYAKGIFREQNKMFEVAELLILVLDKIYKAEYQIFDMLGQTFRLLIC